MVKRPRKNGFEQDAFGRWGRRYLIWRAGERKAAKTTANRRERRQSRERLRAGNGD